MDKITHQVRAEHWARILNECMYEQRDVKDRLVPASVKFYSD